MKTMFWLFLIAINVFAAAINLPHAMEGFFINSVCVAASSGMALFVILEKDLYTGEM